MKKKTKSLPSWKSDFPIFSKRKVVYLDSAATSQKPKRVISKVCEVYENYNSNVHRGIYSLSSETTENFEMTRVKVAEFIGASVTEIVFTKGTTESLNLLAYTIKSILPKNRKTILLTEMEHHANLIPWQELCKREKLKLEFVKIKKDFTLDEVDLKRKLTKDVAVFSFTGVSNVFGTKLDIKHLCALAREQGAFSIVDAAQLVPHEKIDVNVLGCDFLTFSGHKMLAPSGIGVLYGKEAHLQSLPPFNTGGSMISQVSYTECTFADSPRKFEAGTPNIEGVIGLGAAIDYLNEIGFQKIQEVEKELTAYSLEELKKVPGIELYYPGLKNGTGIISFNLKGMHSHDVASLLDDFGVCVRVGHHCNMPIMTKLGIAGTVRVSLYLYNTKEDIDALISGLKKIVLLFKKTK